MEDLLNEPWVRIGLGIVVVAILVSLAKRLFAKPKTSAYHVAVRCPSCGWQGQVGKYNRRCSSCGNTTLESLPG
jgi:ribosomal protein S27E